MPCIRRRRLASVLTSLGANISSFSKTIIPPPMRDLALFFEDPHADHSTWGFFSQTDKGHGRLTTRTVRTTTEMNEWFASEWAGIAQSFQVTRTLKRKRRKVIEQAQAGEPTRASELEPPSQQTQATPPPKTK